MDLTAESALEFEALEEQAARIMGVFTRARYERVAPSIIQPASLFLDRIGESIRARTYVFTDSSGDELCLRPDLTAPVCRIYVERVASGAVRDGEIQRFCYNGPAFRMQEGKPDPMRPREFRQAGIEHFGGMAAEAGDIEVVTVTLAALKAAGLTRYTLKLGHLGLFSALLGALDMPDRWRARLKRAFWRRRAFARELKRLTSSPANGGGAILARLGSLPEDRDEAGQRVLDYLDGEGVALIGQRRPAEIAAILLERQADAREKPLAPGIAETIEAYLRINGPVPVALRDLKQLAARAAPGLDPAIADFETFHQTLAASGVDPARMSFAADFGRQIEYYTGMVFQAEIEGAGTAGQVAGGGRYDTMLRAIGCPRDVPAVGAAIHTQRLLAAARGRLS
jgi:ATP phosphoribosyltransferase regulatory subunit